MQRLAKGLRLLVSRLLSRLSVTVLLLLTQILWMALLLSRLTEYARWLGVAGTVLSVVMCLVLVRQDSTPPEFKISWIILFIVMPVPGGLLYLMWGDKRPAWKLRRKLRRAAEDVAPLQQAPDAAAMQALRQGSPRLANTAAYLERNGFALYGDTAVDYYPSGEAFFAALLPALEKAERFIFLEFFIISQGEMWQAVLDVLRRKAAAGVDVRVIYDDAGCVKGLPIRYWRRLEADGIRAVPFNPFVPLINLVMNNRDHRKIVVVDGNVAFTGGANLADEYINRTPRFGHWRDTAVRLSGPAAWRFATMFLELWYIDRPGDRPRDVETLRPLPPAPCAAGCLVQPYCDDPVERENLAKNVYLELVNQAQEQLYICTPYLIVDNDLLSALRLAARRGVDLRIYTPGVPDKKLVYQLTRSYFAPLLEAGVHIFTYTPGFLHSKTWLCDGRVGVVGTINLDYRSLYLHFECATLVYGGAALQDIRRDMQALEAASAPVTLADCRTSIPGTLVSAVLRLLAPLC